MKINSSEAETSLAAIRSADQQMQQALNKWGVAYHLINWGIISLIGYPITHFYFLLPDGALAWTWIVLNIIGMSISWTIGFRMQRRFHYSISPRIGFLWLVFILYGVLGAFFLHPADGLEVTLLITIYTMFWLAVMGIWLNPILLWIALAMTGFAVFGYILLHGYFFLWMALLIGGTMTGTGIYLLRSGK
jgi:hypothetical protein